MQTMNPNNHEPTYNGAVLVYQMGKVGSMSIYESIKQYASPDILVLHLHFMMQERMQIEGEIARSDKLPTQRVEYSKNALQELVRLRQVLDSLTQRNEKIKIICGVREPVSKSLSAFFENIHTYFPFFRILPEEFSSSIVAGLFEDLYRKYQNGMIALHSDIERDLTMTFDADTWFTAEIMAYLNIQFSDIPFDHTQGYIVYKKDNIEVLIYRFENINNIPSVLPEFLGNYVTNDFNMQNQNMSDQKGYAKLYQLVKNQVGFDNVFLDKVYDCDYCNHFYTRDEMLAFKEKHSKSIDTNDTTSPFARYQQEIEKYQMQIDTAQNALQDYADKVTSLENQLNLIQSSRSWRATKPLRSINKLLKA